MPPPPKFVALTRYSDAMVLALDAQGNLWCGWPMARPDAAPPLLLVWEQMVLVDRHGLPL